MLEPRTFHTLNLNFSALYAALLIFERNDSNFPVGRMINISACYKDTKKYRKINHQSELVYS